MTSIESTENKWTITIDAMMIIGKYFDKNEDYVNVMRTCKRYHDLVKMYHFNPIGDCSLFENIETQYLYRQRDKKQEGMHHYVYWYTQGSYRYKKREENEIMKRIEMNQNYLVKKEEINNISNGECTVAEGMMRPK